MTFIFQMKYCIMDIFSATLGRSSTFCAIFTAMEQLRAKKSADVSQLIKSFYTNNPGVAYNQVHTLL